MGWSANSRMRRADVYVIEESMLCRVRCHECGRFTVIAFVLQGGPRDI